VSQKCDVDFVVLQFDMFMLDVLHIKPMSNSVLYAKFVVVFLVLMLTIVQLFDDVLLSIPMTTTLMSLVAIVVTTNMM
jgi:hypothetical protein